MLSPAEAAGKLGYSTATLLRWIKRGQLRAYRINGHYRIRPEDLDGFLAASIKRLDDERRTNKKEKS